MRTRKRLGTTCVICVFCLAQIGCHDESTKPLVKESTQRVHTDKRTSTRRETWPPRIEAACQVDSLKVPPGVLREQWGPSALEADIYIFGCQDNLGKLEQQDRDILEKEFRRLLREHEGSLYWAQDDLRFRRDVVRRLNSILGREVILDFRVRDMRHIDSWPATEVR